MPDRGRRDLRAKIADAKISAARQAAGLAPKNLISHAKPGAVFSIKDSTIVFPEDRREGSGVRALHATRRAIIVQCAAQARALSPRTLLVVPCSASQRGVCGHHDLEIPAGEPGFNADQVVAYASLVQPVLKADLDVYHGQISDQTLQKLQSVLAVNLGLIQATSLALPPRMDEVPAPAIADASE